MLLDIIGTQEITLIPDFTDKVIKIIFYNWFNNLFYEEEAVLNEDNTILFEMTADKSKQFIKGIYYLHIKVDDNLYFSMECRVN